ncbi:MAG: hypothetical protein VX278_11770, partial [Myxococcota bacterium]|nr:hypothetical protein [Myxococcota bacterium]
MTVPNHSSLSYLQRGRPAPFFLQEAIVVESNAQLTKVKLSEGEFTILPTGLLLPASETNDTLFLVLHQGRLQYATKDKEANITLSTHEIVSPSFTIEIKSDETGSSLRCNENQFRMLLLKGEEEYSVLSYSNELETIPKDQCIHLPVTPEVLPEMNVRIPYLGTYTEGTVLKQSKS